MSMRAISIALGLCILLSGAPAVSPASAATVCWTAANGSMICQDDGSGGVAPGTGYVGGAGAYIAPTAPPAPTPPPGPTCTNPVPVQGCTVDYGPISDAPLPSVPSAPAPAAPARQPAYPAPVAPASVPQAPAYAPVAPIQRPASPIGADGSHLSYGPEASVTDSMQEPAGAIPLSEAESKALALGNAATDPTAVAAPTKKVRASLTYRLHYETI